MKSALPVKQPDHPSYQRHKRQLWTQILLPILIVAILLIAVIVLMVRATFHGGGDVGRWAAISTMWLVLPVMIGGLIFLAVIGALIALAIAAGGAIPAYSYRIQRFFYRIEYGTSHAASMVHRPILIAQGLLSVVKSGLKKARERIW